MLWAALAFVALTIVGVLCPHATSNGWFGWREVQVVRCCYRHRSLSNLLLSIPQLVVFFCWSARGLRRGGPIDNVSTLYLSKSNFPAVCGKKPSQTRGTHTHSTGDSSGAYVSCARRVASSRLPLAQNITRRGSSCRRCYMLRV